MAQTLLIGLGGTGSRVVGNVVKELRKNNKGINSNGNIYCAVLDTDSNDNSNLERNNPGLPVIATGGTDTIGTYLNRYSYLNPASWCPMSTLLAGETISNGASEVRIKSRIAFMNCIESGKLDTLKELINDMLKNNDGKSSIRIMIVSSLSGGSGSGMFIQVALWLRQYLAGSDVLIRGIFLLPDIFIQHGANVSERKMAHYANAYAAIRELNIISMTQLKPDEIDLLAPIQIQGLFDSSKLGINKSKPVFDFSFFIDDKDANGVTLNTIQDYEKMVAHIVYMQLYAPMKTQMYSEEDNLYTNRVGAQNTEYGSCSTAKVVYPFESVLEYCALRATEDSLTEGWLTIDEEVNALVREKKERERDGDYSGGNIDKAAEYVRQFDNLVPKKEEDLTTPVSRFFNSIAKDVKNKTVVGDGTKETDKADDFVDSIIKKQQIEVLVSDINKKNGVDARKKDPDAYVKQEHDVERLKKDVEEDQNTINKAITAFEGAIDEHVRKVVDAVFPLNMGNINAADVKPSTVFGLLTKPSEENQDKREFIHPVAARYVLYKLVEKLENDRKAAERLISTERTNLLVKWSDQNAFDNPKTKNKESTPTDYLESKKWYQGEENFTNNFEKGYARFINNKVRACDEYEKMYLQVKAYAAIVDRVKCLINKLEAFFADLGDVRKSIDSRLAKNISSGREKDGKILYVYDGKDAKEAMYQSLGLKNDNDKSSKSINKSIVESVYGMVCAEKRPSASANAQYRDRDIVYVFIRDTMDEFKGKIKNDPEKMKKVDLDICQAIFKASDMEFEANGAKGFNSEDRLVDNKEIIQQETDARHKTAFNGYKNKLERLAAVSLQYVDETPGELGSKHTLEKTFWGFDPEVEKTFGAAKALGCDIEKMPRGAYPKNELCCYHSVYGLTSDYIPKFYENDEGLYYKYYCSRIKNMLDILANNQGKPNADAEAAYILTPHLDKTWHRYLPYLTKAKRDQFANDFYRGIWLAIAYGTIKCNKDGNACIRRSLGAVYEDIELQHDGLPVKTTDVAALVNALRADPTFVDQDIPRLEKQFAADIRGLDSYEGTRVLQELTKSSSEYNPVKVVTRYAAAVGYIKDVHNKMLEALQSIASDMVTAYGMERDEESANAAKYRILKRIYDSGESKNKESKFEQWIEQFNAYKIK